MGDVEDVVVNELGGPLVVISDGQGFFTCRMKMV